MSRTQFHAYFGFFRINLITELQYPLPAVSRTITNLFWGFIRIMFFSAFYTLSPNASPPMALNAVVGYLWLDQMLISTMPSSSGDPAIQQCIITGDVGYELCRPLQLYRQWFARTLGTRLSPLILQSIPIWLISTFLLPSKWQLPLPTWQGAFMFLLSVCVTLMMSAALTGIINVLFIKSQGQTGYDLLVQIIIMALSGTLVPLPLYPAWAQGIMRVLPFRGLLDIPAQLYLGTLAPNTVWPTLAQQLIWTVVLIGIGELWMAQTLRKLVIQGG